MCGIAGHITKDPEAVRQTVPRMVAAQHHRGPNASGFHYADFGPQRLGLGHNRLSIIDLSEAGAQPMVDPRTGNVLVFNGEIYNFKVLRAELEAEGVEFNGHSDTEVLLIALSKWGVKALSRLQGMFAFAFLDRTEKNLLLARDPVGIKPLYYAEGGFGLLFASEVRAILATRVTAFQTDRRAVGTYLAFGAIQEPDTFFKQIKAFPAGCYAAVSLAGGELPPLRFSSYWNFPRPVDIAEKAAVSRVRATLEESVRDHLVSDVPLGVFLSSGIDSTIVAALASRLSANTRTFTVGFAEHQDLTENTVARETAKRLGVRHCDVFLRENEVQQGIQDWLVSLDQPSIDGGNVFVISKAVKAAGITVALSGQGGDELFGGYPSFRDVPKLVRLLSVLRRFPKGCRTSLLRLLMSFKSKAALAKALDIANSDGSVLSVYLHRRRTLANGQLQALGVVPSELDLTFDFLPPTAVTSLETGTLSVEEQVGLLETKFYLGNMLLRDGDTNGMAHSLEIRVPFLDTRMLQLAFSLPGSVRMPASAPSKHLLRAAFADVLPTEVTRQKKQGFHLPIKRWMLGPLRELCESSLATLKGAGLVDPQGVDGVWRAYLAEPESPAWSRAWGLCILGAYLQQHTAPESERRNADKTVHSVA